MTTSVRHWPATSSITASCGSAASDPNVPGATGARPQPNQVESQTAGCEKGSVERAIALERQGQRCHRLRRDAFAAAGEAEPLGRRRLDADALRIEVQDLSDARNHRRAVRPDLWAFANQRHVDMRDAAARLRDEVCGVAQEAMRRRAAPLRIARR